MVEQRDERFADGELGDGFLDVELGVLPEGLRGALHGFLVARRKGAQGVLHAVAELAEDFLGDVDGVLRDEIHAHTFRPDKADDLLNFVFERLGDVVEKEVRLVEEEHELWFVEVADFGEALEEFAEQPEERGGVSARAVHELVGAEDIDDAAAAVAGLDEVVEIERGLAEKFARALLLELEQAALDRADAGGADVAVFHGEFGGVLADEAQHFAQVFEVEQKESVVVGDAKEDLQHALLGVVEIEDAGEEQRPHLGNRRAHGVAADAENVPEGDRVAGEFEIVDPEQLQALVDLRIRCAWLREPAQVAFDVGHENGHADVAEMLGETLQRDRLAGAGRAGDEPVAVAHFRVKEKFVVAFGDEKWSGHGADEWARKIGPHGMAGRGDLLSLREHFAQ